MERLELDVVDAGKSVKAANATVPGGAPGQGRKLAADCDHCSRSAPGKDPPRTSQQNY